MLRALLQHMVKAVGVSDGQSLHKRVLCGQCVENLVRVVVFRDIPRHLYRKLIRKPHDGEEFTLIFGEWGYHCRGEGGINV